MALLSQTDITAASSLDDLLRALCEADELLICCKPKGVFDEAAFRVTGRLALLERWGFVTCENAVDPRRPAAEEWLRYAPTALGRQVRREEPWRAAPRVHGFMFGGLRAAARSMSVRG